MRYALALSVLLAPALSFAALSGQPEKNIELLKAIPLFPGVEKKLSGEDDATKTLVGIFTKIQNESMEKKKLERGTHARGSCFTGELEVLSNAKLKKDFLLDDKTIARVRQGLFSKDAVLSTTIRFANAKGTTESDTIADVRGASFSVQTTKPSVNGDMAQDFMMNTTPSFPTKDILEFEQLLRFVRTTKGDLYFVNPFYLGALKKAGDFVKTYERNDTLSYAVESYWGNVAYSHGLKPDGSPAEIVKYKLSPCNAASYAHESSAGKSSDYLQVDIDKRAARGQVCFLLQVQLFDQSAMEKVDHKGRKLSDWIEKNGELWSEKILPFVPVARLTIEGDGQDATTSSKKISCDDVAVSTLLHSRRENQPLSSLARVRAIVEENSRARRMGEKK